MPRLTAIQGNNGDVAARVSFTLQPVKYWYNVIFDPTVWFLCYFITRDVLGKVKVCVLLLFLCISLNTSLVC